jgi:hypothetical protein
MIGSSENICGKTALKEMIIKIFVNRIIVFKLHPIKIATFVGSKNHC